jgi:hypothetical protein
LCACDFAGPNEQDGGFWAPSDATNAVGPTRYIALVNSAFGIYDRSGNVIASGPSGAIYGTGSSFISDPQVMWDQQSQRFFFAAVANKGSSHTPDWGLVYGFSTSDTPSSASDWCNYFLDGNYGSSLPDFPRLGMTQDFALIGANRFTGTTAVNTRPRKRRSAGIEVVSSFLGSDVSWIAKPAAGPLANCPALGTNGIFRGLRTAAGNPATTPEPTRETDASGTGWIIGNGDPLPATTIDLYAVTNQGGQAHLSAPTAITVGTYTDVVNPVPQSNGNALDPGDSRLQTAWLAPDSRLGHDGIWTAQTIAGGAGAQVRWYEIDPVHASIDQTGTISDPNVDIYYPAIAPDRGNANYGSGMAMSLATSSATQPTAAAAVHKLGNNATSDLVVQKASTVPWKCTPDPSIGACRWGDYNGASPDPAPGTNGGQVWLIGEWNTSTLWQTWNWQISP